MLIHQGTQRGDPGRDLRQAAVKRLKFRGAVFILCNFGRKRFKKRVAQLVAIDKILNQLKGFFVFSLAFITRHQRNAFHRVGKCRDHAFGTGGVEMSGNSHSLCSL
ncbi:hypothetical protein D3C71_1628770 [compost metagenome]